MRIEPLDDSTYPVWVEMRRDFWEDDEATVREAYARYKTQYRDNTAVTYFAVDEEERYLGFLDAELRSDFVDGAAGSPIWYVEGIYIVPGRRGTGVGRFLMNRFEDHVREQGHTEIASDCELGNDASEAFHKAVGFKEAIRSIHFVKAL